MGIRTNGSGLGLGQGNNCPGPICPRIVEVYGGHNEHRQKYTTLCL